MSWFLRSAFYLLVVRPFLFLVIGIAVKGKQHLCAQRQYILIANHNSHMDTIVLMSLLPLGQMKRTHPVAAADYFCTHKAVDWFVRVFFNILPIPRRKFTRENNPIDLMSAVLAAGDSLILYPEGSRGEPEQLAKFNTGAGHLLEKHPGLTVIPIYMEGMGRILPKGAWYPVPFIGRVNVGEPRTYHGTAREITAQLEADIKTLRADLHPETAALAPPAQSPAAEGPAHPAPQQPPLSHPSAH